MRDPSSGLPLRQACKRGGTSRTDRAAQWAPSQAPQSA